MYSQGHGPWDKDVFPGLDSEGPGDPTCKSRPLHSPHTEDVRPCAAALHHTATEPYSSLGVTPQPPEGPARVALCRHLLGHPPSCRQIEGGRLQAALAGGNSRGQILTVSDCVKWNRLSTRESLGSLKMILTLSGSSGCGSGGRHSDLRSFSSFSVCKARWERGVTGSRSWPGYQHGRRHVPAGLPPEAQEKAGGPNRPKNSKRSRKSTVGSAWGTDQDGEMPKWNVSKTRGAAALQGPSLTCRRLSSASFCCCTSSSFFFFLSRSSFFLRSFS